MSMIAFFENTFNKNFSTTSPESVIQAITSDIWRDHILYLRSVGKNEYQIEKKKTGAVTWSGTFVPGTRSIQTMIHYTQLVPLDVDDVDPTAIPLLKKQLAADPYVRYCFTSPSGTGIKIIVQVNTDKDQHRHAFLHLQNYFESNYGFKVDPSGKDVSRLCYISWDEQAIINQHSQVFEVDMKYGDIQTEYTLSETVRKSMHAATKIFKVCVKWVERNKTYREGERNVFIHALACALNRCGVEQSIATQLIDEHYVTPDRKWLQSVRSAYFHNMHEHNTVELRDMGSLGTFIAPPFIQTYSEDVAENDLMMKAGMLHQYGVPFNDILDVVHKIGMYYNASGYLDVRRKSLPQLIESAVVKLRERAAQQAAEYSLKYQTPEEMAKEMVSMDLTGGIPVNIPAIDKATGGLFVGSFYGLIGFGETFKSVFAQALAYHSANNDVPTLYLNGEMAKMQFLDRLCKQTMKCSLRYALSEGYLTVETIESFTEQMLAHTKNNLFVYNGINFTKENILSTIDHIFSTTGKKIQLVIMDGFSQMDQLGREEASANIHNSMVGKEIVKAAHNGEGVAMLALMHCSGKENKLLRNTGSSVRGGSKVIANLDGYFSTSLFLDPDQMSEENPDDIYFREGKFCLRYADKRGGSGITTVVLNVGQNLEVIPEETDYKQYEVKV